MVLVISINNRRYWWLKWDCISLIFGRVGDKKRRKTDSQTLCALCNAYFVHERIGTEPGSAMILFWELCILVYSYFAITNKNNMHQIQYNFTNHNNFFFAICFTIKLLHGTAHTYLHGTAFIFAWQGIHICMTRHTYLHGTAFIFA